MNDSAFWIKAADFWQSAAEFWKSTAVSLEAAEHYTREEVREMIVRAVMDADSIYWLNDQKAEAEAIADRLLAEHRQQEGKV